MKISLYELKKIIQSEIRKNLFERRASAEYGDTIRDENNFNLQQNQILRDNLKTTLDDKKFKIYLNIIDEIIHTRGVDYMFQGNLDIDKLRDEIKYFKNYNTRYLSSSRYNISSTGTTDKILESLSSLLDNIITLTNVLIGNIKFNDIEEILPVYGTFDKIDREASISSSSSLISRLINPNLKLIQKKILENNLRRNLQLNLNLIYKYFSNISDMFGDTIRY